MLLDILEIIIVIHHAKRDLMGIAKSIDPGQPAQFEAFRYWQIVCVLSQNST